jgi:hypothetical protein
LRWLPGCYGAALLNVDPGCAVTTSFRGSSSFLKRGELRTETVICNTSDFDIGRSL